ncbi:MAG: adenosine kinase [Paludibacteraceae bacterium]|nr:adenosine kinase [Paludibacteraceae bacterium]
MKKVIGIGNALTDILIQVDDNQLKSLGFPKGSMEYVDAGTSGKIRQQFADRKQTLVAGGSVSNTIKALARIGGVASFLGCVGNDDIGRNYQQVLEQKGGVSHVKTCSSPSGNCTRLITPHGVRTKLTNLGASTCLDAADLTPDLLSHYDIFHTEGYLVSNRQLISDCMHRAKLAGLKVSIDLASYNIVRENYEFLHQLVEQYVDIVFANEDEARAFTHREPHEALREIARITDYAVVKLGAHGSLIMHEDKTYTVPATPSKAIDTTGAGDFYAAGFLYGLASGMNLQQAGELGAFVSGKVVEVIGPNLDNETWQDVRRHIGLC